MSDRAPLTETRCLRLRIDRKYVIQLCVLPVIPYDVSFDRRRLCGTLSKALAKSVFCYPMSSSSHGVSLLVETRKTVLTEIHVGSEG